MHICIIKNQKKNTIKKNFLVSLKNLVSLKKNPNSIHDSLRSESQLPKNIFIYFNERPSKMMKITFYFILKARSQDIWIFVLTSWLCRKNGFNRKIKLISTIMTSQRGWKTITVHILLNISWSKGNHQPVNLAS